MWLRASGMKSKSVDHARCLFQSPVSMFRCALVMLIITSGSQPFAELLEARCPRWGTGLDFLAVRLSTSTTSGKPLLKRTPWMDWFRRPGEALRARNRAWYGYWYGELLGSLA